MKHLFVCTLLLAALLARPAAAQTRRSVNDAQLWADLQAELALKNNDYLLLSVHGENVTTYNGATYNTDRFLGFDQRSVNLAYEHFWNDRWSYGGKLQYESVSGAYTYLTPELLLRHRSPVGPLTFGQRLSFSRIFPIANKNMYVTSEAQNYASLRFDLEKILPLGSSGMALRPRLSYEGTMHIRFQKDQDAAEERTIQYTSLRGEVGVRVGDHFDFTPWFAYTTAYYITIGQYNPIGSPIGGGRLNVVTPVVGLDVRFTLFSGKADAERKQLPTQH
jgi:opacity protein-like surface antigen